MNYSSEPYMNYTTLAEREFRTAIEPAITRAGGRILAAVHLGSTANSPPPYKIWDILLPEHAVISRRFWGWIGPNDVDLLVIYDGTAPADALTRQYASIREDIWKGYLTGELPPEHLRPVLDPAFYSKGFVDGLIKSLSESRQAIAQVPWTAPGYTEAQASNRTLVRFADFVAGRTMGLGANEADTEYPSALVTSSLSFFAGMDYAKEVAGRMQEAFWPAEVNAMKGEKEGKKQYVEMALARARKETGSDLTANGVLRLNIYYRDSMSAYMHLKRGAEIRDPYGNLCQTFLQASDMFGDLILLHEEARIKGKDTTALIKELKGVPSRHKTPAEVECATKKSKVFYTLEEFVRELERKE